MELYGQAVLKDKSEKTEAFLENAINLHNNDDATIIRTVLDSEPTIGFENYKDDNIQKKFEKKLTKKIEEL